MGVGSVNVAAGYADLAQVAFAGGGGIDRYNLKNALDFASRNCDAVPRCEAGGQRSGPCSRLEGRVGSFVAAFFSQPVSLAARNEWLACGRQSYGAIRGSSFESRRESLGDDRFRIRRGNPNTRQSKYGQHGGSARCRRQGENEATEGHDESPLANYLTVIL